MKRLDMTNRIFILLIFNMAIFFTLRGQTAKGVIDQMNDIKLDESFIFGEGSHVNKDVAYENAMTELLSYANEIRLESGKVNKIIFSDVSHIVKQINHFDGNRYCILIYIQRDPILSMAGYSQAQESLSTLNAKPEAKESIEQTEPKNPDTPKGIKVNEKITPLPDDMLYILSAQDNWMEIQGLLTKYKSQGKIKEAGQCTDISKIPAGTYRFLMDGLYGILAFLAPTDSNNVINLKTSQIDKDSNYPNCKVIVWFR